ncbi:MAG: hypothetical protein V3U08_04485, partial [Nitrospirales bacterium]
MLTPLAQLNCLHCSSIMAEQLDPNDLVTLDELALSSMWEMAVLVEMLERKGMLRRVKDERSWGGICDQRRHLRIWGGWAITG